MSYNYSAIPPFEELSDYPSQFKKMFNSSVPIMLTMTVPIMLIIMRILNYS
jgi:hypothetical protein